MDNQSFYYDLVKFETQMIATRSTFLLFFQSILLNAIINLSNKESFIPVWSLIILGLFVSFITGYLNWLTSTVIKHAEQELKKYDNGRTQDIFDSIRKNSEFYRKYGTYGITITMTYIFPLLTAMFWLYIAISYAYSQ